jgi:aminopeptidase N
LATQALLRLVENVQAKHSLQVDESLLQAFRKVLIDESLDPAFRAQVWELPAETYLAEQMIAVDPEAIHKARQFLRATLASALQDELQAIYQRHHHPNEDYSPDVISAGQRALKNLALGYLMETNSSAALTLAQQQYSKANNMTDRAAALMVLIHHGGTPRDSALHDFYRHFENEPLVIDKWFAMQAMQHSGSGKRVIEIVQQLTQHRMFTLRNPNRARALIFSFCAGNPAQFHAADGSGYRFWKDHVLALDAINPQVAARLARMMDRWSRYIPPLRDQMRSVLRQVSAAPSLSRDVREIISKALGESEI